MEYRAFLEGIPENRTGEADQTMIAELNPLCSILRPPLEEFDSLVACLMNKAEFNSVDVINGLGLKGKALFLLASSIPDSAAPNVVCRFEQRDTHRISVIAVQGIKAGEMLTQDK